MQRKKKKKKENKGYHSKSHYFIFHPPPFFNFFESVKIKKREHLGVGTPSAAALLHSPISLSLSLSELGGFTGNGVLA
jgi:hypothetical protein